MTTVRSQTLRQSPTSAVAGRSFGIALAVAALSGAAALTHELIWTRRLIDLLGASGSSSARVFGGFVFGLALGAAWISTRVERLERPWRAAAIAELMVAALTLPSLSLHSWTGWLWPTLGPEALTGPMGGWVKLLVSILLLLPPTFAMGVFLPCLASAILRARAATDRDQIALYAWNTLGGVLGLGIAVLIALPHLGASLTQALAIALNLLIAGLLLMMDRSVNHLSLSADIDGRGTRCKSGVEATTGSREGAETDEYPRAGLGQFVAFGSGALVLAAEVAGLQMLMLAAPLTFHAPAAVLATVIATLAASAFLTRFLLKAGSSGTHLVVASTFLAALLAALAPPIFIATAAGLGDLVDGSNLAGFLLRVLTLTVLGMGPVLLAAGLVFPASLAMARPRDSTSSARYLARALSWNGVGGVLGAELAHRYLIPALGVHLSLVAIGAGYAVLSLVVALSTRRVPEGVPPLLYRFGPILAIGVVWMLGEVAVRDLPHMNPALRYRVLSEEYGREGVVAVIEGVTTGRSILLSNQYVLGGTGARWDQERQTHLPLLLHPDPRQVAFIGLATGISPGAALEHPRVTNLTAIELSPLIVRAADRWFKPLNHGVTRDPRARIVVEDGRTYLAASRKRFDVVVGDLFLPWGPGEGRLFTVQQYRDVRASLRPGGLYCQWLPLYQFTPEQLEWVLASFRDAFPETHYFLNNLGVERPVLAMLGWADGGGPDWEVVHRRCAETRQAGLVRDPLMRHAEGLELLHLGCRTSAAHSDIPRNTLDNLRLEIDSSIQRTTGIPGRKYLHRKRWLQWLDQFPDNNPKPRGPALAIELLGQDQRRLDSGTDAATIQPEVLQRVPSVILDDPDSDWTRWPGVTPALRDHPSERR